MFNNQLHPSQTERLALLAEELGEAQHAIGKVLRHGYDSTDPTKKDGVRNRELLERELGDILFTIELLCVTDLEETNIEDSRVSKAHSVWKWLHHQDWAKKLYTHRWPATMNEQ